MPLLRREEAEGDLVWKLASELETVRAEAVENKKRAELNEEVYHSATLAMAEVARFLSVLRASETGKKFITEVSNNEHNYKIMHGMERAIGEFERLKSHRRSLVS